MLTVKDLCVSYLSKKVIEDLNLEVDFPCIVAVLGNNGSGKSTFLHALRHQIPFDGLVLVDEVPITVGNSTDYFSYLGQSYQFNFPFLVSEFIRINHSSKEYDEHFLFLVKKLEIEFLLNEQIETLSQGQLQKCLIAQTLMQDSCIMLLDEPESFLDIKNRNVLANTLRSYKKYANKILLVVTHDLDLVTVVADKILNFSGDGIVLDNNTVSNIAKHRSMLLR